MANKAIPKWNNGLQIVSIDMECTEASYVLEFDLLGIDDNI